MIGKTNAISGVSAPVPKIKTVSGSVISIFDALAQAAESLVVDINAVQSGSGDPSPSNVRPISGWSNVNVYREAQYDAGATPYATISLNGTVYGGSLDVTTGVLTVDRAMVDMGTLSWIYRSNINGMSATLSPTAKDKFNAICSIYPFKGSYSNMQDKECGYVYNNNVFVKDSDYTDAATFKTEMNGVQLVYELATPQTVQLTPTQVQMLLGNNTLWADSGDIELQYWARR